MEVKVNRITFPEGPSNLIQKGRYIAKSIQESLNTNRIRRIWIIPDHFYGSEQFIPLSIDTTEEFVPALKAKVDQQIHRDQRNDPMFYKIISEKRGQRYEYLVSLLIVQRDCYLTMTKAMQFHRDVSINWLPVEYSQIKSYLLLNPDQDKNVLMVSCGKEHTNLIYLKGSNIVHAKMLAFGVEGVYQSLKADHYSDNQTKSALEDMDFTEYKDQKQYLSYQILMDSMLNDMRRNNQIVSTLHSLNLQEGVLITNMFQRNKLDHLLSSHMEIPIHYMDYSFVEQFILKQKTGKQNIPLEELFVVVSVIEVFRRVALFLPLNTIKRKWWRRTRIAINPKKWFNTTWQKLITLSVLLILISFIGNTYLTNALKRSQRTLYSMKNRVTRVKQQYADISNDMRQVRKYHELADQIKENQNIVQQISNIVDWIFALKEEGMSINQLRYENGHHMIYVEGRTTDVNKVNEYFDSIGKKTDYNNLSMNKLKRINDKEYFYLIGIKVK